MSDALPQEATSYATLAIDHPTPHIMWVRLNRPDAANAINTQMGREMVALFEGVQADPGPLRAIVLAASGERVFCAGGDLKERRGMTDAQWQAQHLVYERMIRAIISCPVPVIATVVGVAYGGGLEIALGCDLIFAAKTARFALTEVTLGIMPGTGGTQTLARAVGERRAKELILSGQPIMAERAYEWGLVNHVCDAPEADALALAERIAANAPLAVRQAKQSIHVGLGMSLAQGMMFEIEAYNRLVGTADRMEGVAAFNEKRSPRFQGC